MSTRLIGNDVFKKHRYIYFAVLLIPVFAIFIALVLISFLGHPKLSVIFVVVSLVLIQYPGMVAYISRASPSPFKHE